VTAELVREIVIDATPETIWPFLTEPDRHVQWLGTVADDHGRGWAYYLERLATVGAGGHAGPDIGPDE
jgi:uncharacterized protein YndB with AHSA1/START domain